MRAQDAYNLSMSSCLKNVLNGIKKAAEAGKFDYLEYKHVCRNDIAVELRELGYVVDIDLLIVRIHWDLESLSQARIEKDTTNHTHSIDN